jgi:hypothetical protein
MHLMLSLGISYPYLIEFHDFVDNMQEGMKHQMGGATHAQQGMTFQIILIFSFYHENGTLLKMWEPVRFSNRLSGENLIDSHLLWQPSIRFSGQLTYLILTGRFSLRTELKTSASFQPMGENRPTLRAGQLVPLAWIVGAQILRGCFQRKWERGSNCFL